MVASRSIHHFQSYSHQCHFYLFMPFPKIFKCTRFSNDFVLLLLRHEHMFSILCIYYTFLLSSEEQKFCVSLFTLTYTTHTHSFTHPFIHSFIHSLSVASTSVRSVINLFHSSSYQHLCNYFQPKISVLQQND